MVARVVSGFPAHKRARPGGPHQTAPLIRLARGEPMKDPARQHPPHHAGGASGEALKRALTAHREALTAKVGLIEAERAAGHLSIAQASEQAHAARAVYDRDCALAEISAETGWECWAG